MRIVLLVLVMALLSTIQAQVKYAEGYLQVEVVDEQFFNEKILSDSDRNKDVIAENMTYYNKMVKAYNSKDYKEAKKWAEEAFWGSIAEKIQFKVYMGKFDYMHNLVENQKIVLFVAMCELKMNINDIQAVYDYCKEILSQDRMDFVKARAEEYNKTFTTKIILVKEYTYE